MLKQEVDVYMVTEPFDKQRANYYEKNHHLKTEVIIDPATREVKNKSFLAKL